MPPKKPFRVPKLSKKQSTPTPPAPSSPQEHLELAIEAEEQGDRWILSDLSKSLRAYQRAYESYRAAVVSGERDAWYNLLRLRYHVYQTYKDVPRSALSAVEGCDVADLTLQGLKKEYREAVEGRFEGWLNWECAHHEVLIDTEIIEDADVQWEEVLRIVEDGVRLVGRILEFQLNELDMLLKRLQEGTTPEVQEENESGKEEEFQMYEQITPSSILETLTTAWKLIQAALEFCDTREQMSVLMQGLEGFIKETLKPSEELIFSRFAPGVPSVEQDMILKEEEIYELIVAQHCVKGLLISDFKELVAHWRQLDEEAHLAEADNYENFLALGTFTSEQIWTIIGAANQSLKYGHELLKTELDYHRDLKTAEVSSKVSKIVQVLINRADNELLRSQLSDYEPSVKNSAVLRQNSINLLKSGLNLSQSNVGLRETSLDKLARQKLRRECIARLVILTKEHPSKEDFVRNLGEEFWRAELDDLHGSAEVYRPVLEALQPSLQ